MTFSILIYLLFGVWAMACIYYWIALYNISRKYPGGLFSLKEILSSEDREILKKQRSKLLLVFIIVAWLILLFFVLQITGNLFHSR